MNPSDSISCPTADLALPTGQAEPETTMFGSSQMPMAPVLHGSPVDEVVTNPRIAIIDDEPINIKVVQKHLQLAGYRQFFTTTISTRALELVRAELPDVVLLDVMMPHISGLEILEQIRGIEELADLPVIILTAAHDQETKLEAFRLGATEFLEKPVDPTELEARMRNVLTLKAHKDRLRNYAWELELEVAARTAELANAHEQVIHCLARVGEYRDNETGNHVIRVGRYAEIIARSLTLDEEFVDRIKLAAGLHDIGKVGIPDSILLKPSKLENAEFAQMQKHCIYGKEICSPSTDAGCDEAMPFDLHASVGKTIARLGNSLILKLAASIAYTHHEKWDGSGYPCGLSGEEIPIEGRIVAVADVFDALTSERPYKAAFSFQKSLGIIEEDRGAHFDPTVVDAFFAKTEEISQVCAEHSDRSESTCPAVGDT